MLSAQLYWLVKPKICCMPILFHSNESSKEDERGHAALSPQIFTYQASQGTKNKSERHVRIDNNSLVSRGIDSFKEARVPVFPSNIGNVGRRLPPPNSQAKPSSNKLGVRHSEARNIPPLSNSSRRSTTKICWFNMILPL